MKLSTLIACAGLLATLGSITVARADNNTETYRYGMTLDIDKVLSVEVPAAPYCTVVTAHMTYVDSQGEVHGLDYQTHAEACEVSG